MEIKIVDDKATITNDLEFKRKYVKLLMSVEAIETLPSQDGIYVKFNQLNEEFVEDFKEYKRQLTHAKLWFASRNKEGKK